MIEIGMPQEPDRVSLRCRKCHGVGQVRRHLPVDAPTRVGPAEFDASAMSAMVMTEIVDCPACGGEGRIAPKDGERVDVVQGGRIVGSCTVPAKVRPHLLVDRRPGDYVPREYQGRMVYEADRMLGPGDIEQLEGFQRAPMDDDADPS